MAIALADRFQENLIAKRDHVPPLHFALLDPGSSKKNGIVNGGFSFYLFNCLAQTQHVGIKYQLMILYYTHYQLKLK
jgi:hypothetical protein